MADIAAIVYLSELCESVQNAVVTICCCCCSFLPSMLLSLHLSLVSVAVADVLLFIIVKHHRRYFQPLGNRCGCLVTIVFTIGLVCDI